MQLEGSCHCGAVSFSLESAHPYPYQRCYCSICRKTQGGGGYAINLGGDARSLKVRGRKLISIYHARMKEPGQRRRTHVGAGKPAPTLIIRVLEIFLWAMAFSIAERCFIEMQILRTAKAQHDPVQIPCPRTCT